MTESADISEIIIGYKKFIIMRAKMASANRKYRATEHGKEKTRIMHRIWCNNHKDEAYMKQTNLKAKERYHRRKAQKLAEKAISLEENTLGEIENDISVENPLGESKIDENEK